MTYFFRTINLILSVWLRNHF